LLAKSIIFWLPTRVTAFFLFSEDSSFLFDPVVFYFFSVGDSILFYLDNLRTLISGAFGSFSFSLDVDLCFTSFTEFISDFTFCNDTFSAIDGGCCVSSFSSDA
jgi:hypothetical protein